MVRKEEGTWVEVTYYSKNQDKRKANPRNEFPATYGDKRLNISTKSR